MFTSDIGLVRVSGVRDLPHLYTLFKAYATVAGVIPETVTVTVIGHIQRECDGKDFYAASRVSYFTSDGLAIRVDGFLQLFRVIGELEATFEV